MDGIRDSGDDARGVTIRTGPWTLLLLWFASHLAAGAALGQDPPIPAAELTPPPLADAETPGKVAVEPVAPDEKIRERLREILLATGWYTDPAVTVKEGVVFLEGRTAGERHQLWASELARHTEGVVAVVNRMEVSRSGFWDLTPAWEEVHLLVDGVVRSLPLVALAIVVLALTWGGGKLASSLLRSSLRPRVASPLLGELAARASGILVFVLGLYLVLRISGLTRLAVTVIGGTGLIGLVLGIAIRDITENFLASLFLSLQHPFREGDLVEMAGVTGYVQRLTSRTTVLMTLDGNQVQVPNATVYKSTIRNFTSSPNRREDFIVGIGYADAIPFAQEVALKVLAEHPAVLQDPEPWVLVNDLGAATVNLRVYFWLDGSRHSWLKVKSSVIRLVKRALQDAGVSLPDEAREVIFPEGIPLRTPESPPEPAAPRSGPGLDRSQPELVSTAAEAGLQSEADQIKEQARQSWTPDGGENLLAPSSATAPAP